MIRVLSDLFLRSIMYWLTLLFLGVLALAVLFVYVYTVRETETRLVGERLEGLRSSAPLIQETLYASLHPDAKSGRILYDRQTLAQQVGYFDGQLDARIVVLTPSNSIVADSRGTPAFFVADHPLMQEARREATTLLGTVTVAGSRYAVAYVPVSRPGRGVVGQVALISSLNDVYDAVEAVEREVTLAAFFAFAVALVTIVLASRLISRRLKRIERGAEAIAAGDFETNVEVGVRDEIGRLGLAFNAMGEQLRAAFDQLGAEKERVTREKERVDLLLNDLSEGVVGLSAAGQILVANPSADRLLGLSSLAGARAADVLPREVLEVWRDCRDMAREVTRTVEYGDAVLDVTAYHVPDEAGLAAIIVVRDATQQAQLDRVRRDFAANASHELRTPLFALAGLLELLMDRELDDLTRRRFLDLMKQQIDRLTRVSGRLLDLSRLEAGAVHLQVGDVDLVALARLALAEAAGLGDVEFELDPAAESLLVQCDGQAVQQVLAILLDNAVKASPPNGRVSVTIVRGEAGVVLTVADEGPGVRAEDAEMIFQRFYRGPTAAASQGSGLGLAIARELVALMGGDLRAEVTNGRGGRFVLTLPWQTQALAALNTP